jgi:hypothetical protein
MSKNLQTNIQNQSYLPQPIDIEHILSLILVKENIRPAFLFQPAFQHDFSSITNTKEIIKKIKKKFPNFIYSDDYSNYQGTIISKKNYNGRNDITNEEMGKILGYPCYNGFDSINTNIQYYTIEIIAETTNGKQYYILTNKSQDKLKLKEFTKIAEKAKHAFTKDKYKHLFRYETFKIDKCYVKVTEEIPTQIIINKLIQNENLTNEEKNKVLNILFNLGFSIIL